MVFDSFTCVHHLLKIFYGFSFSLVGKNILIKMQKESNKSKIFFQIDQQTKSNEVKIPKKCCWCCQTLTVSDRPKLLECFHVSCEQCIKSKLQEQQKLQLQSCSVISAQCPICKMDNRSDYIIENQFLTELLNSTSADEAGSSRVVEEEMIKCSSCSDENPATSWCVECSEYICDSCVQAHQRLKITKDHTIKSKDEADNKVDKATSKDIKCHMHPQVSLDFILIYIYIIRES